MTLVQNPRRDAHALIKDHTVRELPRFQREKVLKRVEDLTALPSLGRDPTDKARASRR